MESEGFRMKVKITSTQQEIEVVIRKGMTLNDLKQECSTALGETTEMKLIYRGKILKESDDLSVLVEGQSLYLVKDQKPKVESPAPVPISSGAGNMTGLLSGLNNFGVMNQATTMLNDLDSVENNGIEAIDPNQLAMISQMMSNPATRDYMLNSMQQMMSNPAIREMLLNSNPTLKRLAQNNPGVLDSLSNPMVIEQMKSMMERMSVGNTMGPLSGDASSFPSPGGAPGNNSTANNLNAGVPLQGGPINPFAQFMGSFPNLMNPNLNQPNNAPLNQPNNPSLNQPINPSLSQPYNPYSNQPINPSLNQPNNPGIAPPMNPFGMFNPMMNPMFNMFNNPNLPGGYSSQFPSPNFFNQPMPFGNPQQSVPTQNLREIYSSQLEKMREVGFINEESNIKALQAAGGDVNAAIERLLNMLG